MTLLAVNDTPVSRKLLKEGRLEVDRFETSGPLTEAAVAICAHAKMPLLLHNGAWNWSLGDPDVLTKTDVLEQTRRRLELTGAPWLSTHLGYSAAQVEFKEGVGFRPEDIERGMHPASARLTREALLEATVQNLHTLQKAITVPLLVENLDFNPTGAYDHVCEPGFITEVFAVTKVDLLLDLAHAQVSASHLGYRIKDYLAELPLERVKQLHVSAPRLAGNILVDVHERLGEADYDLLAYTLGKTEPWAVTLEYGKDEDALQKQLVRLQELLTQ